MNSGHSYISTIKQHYDWGFTLGNQLKDGWFPTISTKRPGAHPRWRRCYDCNGRALYPCCDVVRAAKTVASLLNGPSNYTLGRQSKYIVITFAVWKAEQYGAANICQCRAVVMVSLVDDRRSPHSAIGRVTYILTKVKTDAGEALLRLR